MSWSKFSYRARFQTIEERFWDRVDKNGPIPEHKQELGSCWVWLAGKFSNGYGAFTWDGKLRRAHHFLIGIPIKPLVTDHLCRNRACVKPSHIEIVTQSINILRGLRPIQMAARKHCSEGHEFTPENTRYTKDHARICRICNAKEQRERRAKTTNCRNGHQYEGLTNSKGIRYCRKCIENGRPRKRKTDGSEYTEEERREYYLEYHRQLYIQSNT